MQNKIYAVYDAKARAYLNPVFYRTHEEAIRAFGQTCKNEQSQFNACPEDFHLHHIGEWYPESAEITPANANMISSATDFLQ